MLEGPQEPPQVARSPLFAAAPSLPPYPLKTSGLSDHVWGLTRVGIAPTSGTLTLELTGLSRGPHCPLYGCSSWGLRARRGLGSLAFSPPPVDPKFREGYERPPPGGLGPGERSGCSLLVNLKVEGRCSSQKGGCGSQGSGAVCPAAGPLAPSQRWLWGELSQPEFISDCLPAHIATPGYVIALFPMAGDFCSLIIRRLSPGHASLRLQSSPAEGCPQDVCGNSTASCGKAGNPGGAKMRRGPEGRAQQGQGQETPPADMRSAWRPCDGGPPSRRLVRLQLWGLGQLGTFICGFLAFLPATGRTKAGWMSPGPVSPRGSWRRPGSGSHQRFLPPGGGQRRVP